ncbi:MAG TPA: efflux RND transporter periplasmic adaptor subunit, partial [Nevskia sp.]|nr:efflux RND transporter periplasmic adaptor subunit [Nevskia sp.]
TRQDVPVYLNGLGSVVAFNTATILAQVSGQLVSVPFKEGEEVDKGALLAQVDPRPFQATLDQAIAKRVQDQATLHSAQLDLKRYQDLLPDGYVSGQQVDQQKALVQSDQALIQADEASIESARVQVSFTSIRAPFGGVTGIRQVDVGNLVSNGNSTGIVVLTQIKPISVTFTLPEQSLPQIRGQDSQPLTVLAVTRDNQTELSRGRLTAFDSQIDATTGTIKLKATFDNQDKKLWPGQFVNARLLVRTDHGALTVPAPAVQLGPNGSYVYKVQADQTVQMVPVTVGQTEANVATITQGLSETDQVVVDGQSRLQPGSKISVATAANTNAVSAASPANETSVGHNAPAADAAAPGGQGGSGSSGGQNAAGQGGGQNGQPSQGHHHHQQNGGSSSGGAAGTSQ